MNIEILKDLRDRMRKELTGNILPFWMSQAVDMENGGFFGRINGRGKIFHDADKGGILHARILWTFSAAYNQLGGNEYLAMAERCKDYILCHFFDKKYKGTYWKITFDGKPAETKKQIYAQAFIIYALAEYYKASGDKVALQRAEELFRLIEEKSFDLKLNGYLEAFSREWELLEDLRLSEKDANEKKTTNTHLHVLEAYTNLFRVTGDHETGRKLWNLTTLFIDKIIHPQSGHLQLFFDESWNSKSSLISYGHDIEASWLILDAASVLKDKSFLNKVKQSCISLAKASLEGLQADGSLIYEKNPSENLIDTDRHWWPQAEAIVGLVNLFEMTGDAQYIQKAVNCWNYVENNLIDRDNGEWYWSIRNGIPNLEEDKTGFWKCPYHNARSCLEIITRADRILKA